MNREIKFRAWLKEKKEMIDNARPDFFCKQLHYLRGNSAGGQDVLGVSTEDIELMQYIGLKDKNNKEIYEEDIVKLRANHGIGVIKYSDEWGAFIVEYIKPRPLAVLGMNYYKEDIEVLGNIYENPELLGGQ